MSGSYSPDDDAVQQGIWATVFLSNRDLSSQIPVNFVTHPSAYLTSACFSNGTYTAGIAQKCVSNLLASQFRRLVLDLYWDEKNPQFAFCPVTIPASLGNGYETVSLTASAISSASLNGTAQLAARQTSSTSGNMPSNTASSVKDRHSSATSTTSSASTSNSIPVSTLNGETLYNLGPYACSPNLDLSFFISVMSSYLLATSDTIQAKLIYLELNLHAAASSTDPTGSAPEPSSFPSPEVLVGAQFAGLDNSPIYQPSDLESERSNLNNTWFKIPASRWPIVEYFTTEATSAGNLMSSDGWPDENYVQLTLAKRVFLEWGTIDPQMSNYNFTGDSSTVFTNNQLSAPRQIQSSAKGELTSGCFYESSQTTSSISNENSSWASTTYNSNTLEQPNLPSNITSCGISPLLNHSLTPLGASNNITPWSSLARATIWNWAPGEPRNTSLPNTDLDAPESQYRCAYLDASTTPGRWFVQDCLHSYRAACRLNNLPYSWTLSSGSAPYGTAPTICPPNSSFEVPRTGLENRYLYEHILASSNSNPELKGVWINFNSLDVPACWVTTGPNGTCPYFEDPNTIQNRQVLVPTIGAIIVLILTALTLFVKCNVNRRNSRNRRRGEGGWDYEGVPS